MKKLLLKLTFILFIGNFSMFAQRITVNGTIFSFKGEKLALLKKAQKNVSFDGSLEGVKIELTGESNNATITTGLSGTFSIPLENPGKFKLVISRAGYSSLEIDINYIDAGKKSRMESLFLILKQGETTTTNMGELEINGGTFIYNQAKSKSKDDIFESNAHLLEKAVLINKSGGGPLITNVSNKNNINENNKIINNKIENNSIDQNAKSDTITGSSSVEEKLIALFENENDASVDDLKSKLAEAKKLLMSLSPDSKEYKILKQQIEMAEQKLKDKEAIIQYQENEIALANKVILYLVLVVIFALGAAGLLFYFFKQKKRYAEILKEKNQNIMRINNRLLSSIRYASLIQTGFLQDKTKLSKLFSDTFVFNQPKDILSGDFYWFSHKNGYRIVVVADCTGHGVPGAMLTVLGHNILEEVINVQGEVVPSKILAALNKGLMQTFANNKHNLEFGMDMTIVSIKDNANEMLVCGVNNGMYLFRNGNKQLIQVEPLSLGVDYSESIVKDQKIEIQKGDNLFMFTDGYADQFSLIDGKRIKFNVQRFEKLLNEISNSPDYKSAENKLELQLKKWQGELEQLDDVCVVGIRI